jgi:hypothetical protein
LEPVEPVATGWLGGKVTGIFIAFRQTVVIFAVYWKPAAYR